MARSFKWALIVFVAALLGAGLYGLHVWMTRPDRVAADRSLEALHSVRDQLLQYQYETGELPERLEQLVPQQLREDQIKNADGPLVVYQRSERWIEEAHGPLIRGLYSKQLPPRRETLPAPDVSLAAAPKPPQPPKPTPIEVVKVDPPVTPAVPIPAVVDARDPVSPKPVDPVATRAVESAPAEVKPPAAALLNERFVLPTGPELADPPAGSYVFEAEHYTQTNYGWEVRADPGVAGGAFLHCKEGIANGPAQTRVLVGNFYEQHSTQDVTMMRLHFRLPKDGLYYIYGRMWTTDTHCSNFVCTALDKGGPYIGGMGNTTPFHWIWSPVKNGDSEGPVNLTAGDHFIHMFIHEDGVKIDQFIISPERMSGGTPYKANLLPGHDTAFAAEKGPRAHIHFDYPTMIIGTEKPFSANLVVRRLRPTASDKEIAKLRTVLQGAGKDGQDLVVAEGDIDLAKLPEIAFLPLSFKDLDAAKLPRREYLLKATLTQADGTVVAFEAPMMRPFSYETFGPGKFLGNEYAGPLDADGEPKESDTRKWVPFAEKSWEVWGVLDFGLQTTGNGLHPLQNQTIYARTRIHVPKAGTYLFKIQSDDQMLLWIDGKEVFRFNETNPVTRTACRVELPLEAGDHRLRFRVNQLEGKWQAMLRIRTKDDSLSDVTGLEPEAPAVEEKK